MPVIINLVVGVPILRLGENILVETGVEVAMIKSKSVYLLLLLVLFSACDFVETSHVTKTEWNDRETYLASLKVNPWQLGGGLTCDTPLPEWHHCTVPKVIHQEHLRRSMHDRLDCQSQVERESIAIVLAKNPHACDTEVLEGYGEAIIRHLTLRMEAMRAKQGNQLPQLTEEQLAECSIEKALWADDPPIVYEFAARFCAWKLNNSARI